MIGIIPSASNTYEIYGSFDTDKPIEGKLYYDGNKRLFYYSTSEKRSSPKTGYFPIWDGNKTYLSRFSNEKYFDKNVVKPDISSMSANIDDNMAKKVIYRQRLSEYGDKLKPVISDEDNLFTQVVKGTILALNITKVDLGDMADSSIVTPKMIDNYYASLSKVTMMRMERFHIWMGSIFHMSYTINVFRGKKQLLDYTWPTNVFNTGIVKYDSIINNNDDPLKKIVKIMVLKENINKANFRKDDVDDYTVNNMITTIHGTKPLSAQIFCRFMRFAELKFTLSVYDKTNKLIFEYRD